MAMVFCETVNPLSCCTRSFFLLTITIVREHVQAAVGEAWVLVDLVILAAMLICLITYSVYIRTLVNLQPQSSYEVYDSLGGAQARLLLPKKQDSTASNGKLD